MFITPLSDLQVTRRLIPAWDGFPNTSIQSKPLLIYHSAFDATAAEISHHIADVGVVKPQWTYTMFQESHYHSNAHEVLCVVRGKALLCFGHEDNPHRYELTAAKGDMIVVPAGLAHRLLSYIDRDFNMVGSYPPGRSWDMCYGKPGDEVRNEVIRALPWFSKDPLYGDFGPVLDVQ